MVENKKGNGFEIHPTVLEWLTKHGFKPHNSKKLFYFKPMVGQDSFEVVDFIKDRNKPQQEFAPQGIVYLLKDGDANDSPQDFPPELIEYMEMSLKLKQGGYFGPSGEGVEKASVGPSKREKEKAAAPQQAEKPKEEAKPVEQPRPEPKKEEAPKVVDPGKPVFTPASDYKPQASIPLFTMVDDKNGHNIMTIEAIGEIRELSVHKNADGSYKICCMYDRS